jgi:hypothetical protein
VNYFKQGITSDPGSPLTAAEVQEEAEVRERIAKRLKAIECPANYREPEALKDKWRLGELRNKPVLTAAEETEETQLTARVAAYEATPEAHARSRISELFMLGYRTRLSAAEKAELESLQSLYPRLPPHPDHPYASAFIAFDKALKKAREDSRLREEKWRRAADRDVSLKREAAKPEPDDGFQEFLD